MSNRSCQDEDDLGFSCTQFLEENGVEQFVEEMMTSVVNSKVKEMDQSNRKLLNDLLETKISSESISILLDCDFFSFDRDGTAF